MARGYGYEYEYRRGGRMRSLRWTGIALLVTAVLLFLLVLLTFVLQIQAFVEEEFGDLNQEYPDAQTLIGGVDVCLQTALGAMLVVVVSIHFCYRPALLIARVNQFICFLLSTWIFKALK